MSPFTLDVFPPDMPREQVHILRRDSSFCSSYDLIDKREERQQAWERAEYVEKALPDWITPDIVFNNSSIEKLHVLGDGHYGTICKGRFRNGNSV